MGETKKHRSSRQTQSNSSLLSIINRLNNQPRVR
jgi:hypothetical protein